MKIMGFAADDTLGRPVITRATRPKGTGKLFMNCLVKLVNGTVVPAVAGNTEAITGTVTALRDSQGRTRQNMDTDETGEVDFSIGPDTVYVAQVSGTLIAADVTGLVNANITAETAVVGTATSEGDQYSKVRINLASKAAYATTGGTQRQILILGTVPVAGLNSSGDANSALGADVQVYCKINPGNYVGAA